VLLERLTATIHDESSSDHAELFGHGLHLSSNRVPRLKLRNVTERRLQTPARGSAELSRERE